MTAVTTCYDGFIALYDASSTMTLAGDATDA